MAKTNETRHIEWHRTSKSNCRLNASVCKGKKRWNNDKCKCECKELTEEDVKRDLHGILVIANVNVINHVMLENIYIMEIVNVERGGFISLFKNLVKILIEMK